jgi:glycosidase
MKPLPQSRFNASWYTMTDRRNHMKPFLYHSPNSQFAYAFDNNTVHLRVIAQFDTIKSITVIYGDPFHFGKSDVDEDVWEWKQQNPVKMKFEGRSTNYDHYFAAVTPTTKRMRYAFLINDTYLFGSQGLIKLSDYPNVMNDHLYFFNFPYINEEDLFQVPKWVETTVWYSIFPDRFHNGDTSNDPQGTLPWGETKHYSNQQVFGGDLQGIINQLDYIAEMGFNGIYLTPIFLSDSVHKYDIIDYFNIDPSFGTKETLKELVTKAHEKGIRIVLDAVFNHCSFRHPFFQDVIKRKQDSPYYDAFHIIDKNKELLSFDIDKDGNIIPESVKDLHQNPESLNYRTFAFTPYMPKIKLSHPLWKKHLLDAAKYWIEEFDIDGWRLDVSDEVPHSFWREFRAVVKNAKLDAYIVGENWSDGNAWLKGTEYDAIMNYEYLFAIWDYFGSKTKRSVISSSLFQKRITNVLTKYPYPILSVMYNLVDSHDTSRFLDICGNEAKRTLPAYVFLFTLPGSPSIFYGSEIGLTGGHDPDNRRCMIFDTNKHNQTIKQHIKRLIKLRKNYAPMKSVSMFFHKTNNNDVLLIEKEELIIILSRTNISTTIKIPTSLQGTYKDIYFDKQISLQNTFTLPPFGFFLLHN